MPDREERRFRRERWLQGLAFVGAVAVLALVAYISAIHRHYQRTNARLLTAMPSLRATAGRAEGGTPGLSSSVLVYESSGRRLVDGSWQFAEPVGALDPARSRWSPPPRLFLGLTRWYKEMVVPVLAESWEVSDYGLVYTFHLRQDAYWVRCNPAGREVSRVRPIVADDVVFSIEQVLRPGRRAPYVEVLYPIQGARERHMGDDTASLGVEALDPFTVRFTLVYPADFFPGLLADPVSYLVPREPVEQYGDDWEEPGKIWVSGPFCPIAWAPGQSVTVLPNLWLPANIRPRLEIVRTGLLYPQMVPGTVDWQVRKTVRTLDPGQAGSELALSQALFLGLTMRAADGQTLLPGLAESWESSDDGRVFTFHLRQGVSWVRCAPGAGGSDRVRDVVADDVVAAVERVLRPDTRAANPEVLFPILGAQEVAREEAEHVAGVEALDPYTVRFTLVTPTADLPLWLADPVAWPVPAEFARSDDLRWSWANAGQMWVDGLFCPLTWDPGRAADLVRNRWLEDEGILASLGLEWGGVLPGPLPGWGPAPRPVPSPSSP